MCTTHSLLLLNWTIYFLPNNPVPAEADGVPKVLPKAGTDVVVVVPKVLPKAGAAVVVVVPKLLPKVGATAAVGWPNVLVPKAGAGVEAAAPNVEPKEGWDEAPNVDDPKPPKPVEVVVVVVEVPKDKGVPKPVAIGRKIRYTRSFFKKLLLPQLFF